jgi:hypothetical protein
MYSNYVCSIHIRLELKVYSENTALVHRVILICICLRARFFVWPSRTSCPIDVTPGTLTATDTCIGYHVTWFEDSRNVILHTRYVSTCVGAGCGRGRVTKIQTKAIRCRACYYSIVFNAHRVTSMADNDIDAVKKAKECRTQNKVNVYLFIFNDESTGSCICLRLDLYMSHVQKYKLYA